MNYSCGYWKRWVWLLAFATLLFSNAWAEDISVSVDVSKTIGAVPDVMRPGIWIQNLGNFEQSPYILDKFFRDIRPAVVQLSIPILQETESFEDFKKVYEEHFSSPAGSLFVQKAKESGTLVLLGFDPCPMSRWLSSNPGNFSPVSDWGGTVQGCSPPRDYSQWRKVVRHALGALREKGLSRLGLYVGHEQERDWVGTEESFFRYYAETAAAVKSVDTSIKVGGPGPSWLGAKRHGCGDYKGNVRTMCEKEKLWKIPGDETFIDEFMDYVAKNGVPLDFLNWHAFNVSPDQFVKLKSLRENLAKRGYQSTELFPGDWSYWSYPPYPDDLLDGTEIAAYIPVAVEGMWKGGVTWQAHDFDVRDYGGRENPVKKSRRGSTFIGDWSLFTWGGAVGGGVVKPMYNSLKLLDMFSRGSGKRPRELLEVFYPEERSVSVLASRGEAEIAVLAVNFVPMDEKRRFGPYVLGKVRAKVDIAAEEVARIKDCVEKNKLPLDEAASVCFGKVGPDKRGKFPDRGQAMAAVLKDLKAAKKETRTVRVRMTGIPFNGKANLTTYVIDSKHANACALNKMTEPSNSPGPCGVHGSVDQAVAKARDEARHEAMREAEKFLEGRGYNRKAIQMVQEGIAQCREGKKAGGDKSFIQCMDKVVDRAGRGGGVNPEKAKRDLREAAKVYAQASRSPRYFRAIDSINSWKDISVEGSRRSEIVMVAGGEFTTTCTMEPNSVRLVILGRE